jgi:hypothetical protein
VCERAYYRPCEVSICLLTRGQLTQQQREALREALLEVLTRLIRESVWRM